MIKAPGLTEISMDIILPSEEFPFVGAYQPQSVFLDKFEDLKKFDNGKKVFSLIITRSSSKQGVVDSAFQYVTLEDYKINEDTKNTFDLSLSLNFKQYIPHKTKKLKSDEDKDGNLKITGKESKNIVEPTMTHYKVGEGETLAVIVKKMLGTTSIDKVKEIAKKNNITDMNNLTPGTVIEF